jgi:hypothetical protein
MTLQENEYRMVVLSRRLRIPGVLESLSDQVPEIRTALDSLVTEELGPALAELNGNGHWAVHSHSVTVHNGLLLASFLVFRPVSSPS